MSKRTAPANGQRKRIALVDADGIMWAAALRGETFCDGQQIPMAPLSRVYQDAVDRIEAQLVAAGCEECFVCLSDRRTFRKDLMPVGHVCSIRGLGYKGQRATGTPRPVMLDQLRAKFVDDSPYRVLLIPTLEADDVCGISAGQLQSQGYETVIISPDKDLLQIPGILCTPFQGKYVMAEVTKQSGDRFHLYQTMMGDTVDNYRGIPGVGAGKAGSFIDLMEVAGLDEEDRWRQVVEWFADAGISEEDALVQAQVARILRAGEWDSTHKRPILWQFPWRR